MKKTLFSMSNRLKAKCILTLGIIFIVIPGVTSCSNDDTVIDEIPNTEETSVTGINGSAVTITNDQSLLSKYVTNYSAAAAGSRAPREDWSMPSLAALTADYDISTDNVDWNAGGTYVLPADCTKSLGWVNLNSNKGYSNLVIYGTATIDGINGGGDIKIYVAPGASLTLNSQDALNTSNKSLYIYAGATYKGSYKVQNGASLYVEGDLNAESAQSCGGNWYVGGAINIDGGLTTDNAHIIAPTMTVTGDWYDQNNASNIGIEHYIQVSGNATMRCQSVINANCLMVGNRMEITNAVTLNIASYIKAGSLDINASGYHINMGKGALLDAGSKLKIYQNGGVNIAFDNDASSVSVIKAEEVDGNIQNYNNVPSLDLNCISGYADLQYVTINSNCEQVIGQQTLTVNGGVDIKADADGCRPSAPGISGGDSDPVPPVIAKVISHIDADHQHDISATCIAINNGKAYVSWHKRGTSIHGCIEAVEVNDGKATLTSWMETETGATQGGNNWDGNSAQSGADELGEHQGEFDFNHIIVVNDGGKQYAVTVGDNASKGGFIGAIELDGNGDFSKSSQATSTFISRQLLTSDDKIGRSGNAVARTADGNYLIACAGGFQEYKGNIADLGIRETYQKSGTSFWKAKLGDRQLTGGSAKHIAIDATGQYVATLEFTERSGNVSENDDYWFNDNTTRLPAVLKVRSASDWLNSVVWTAPIDGGISPIYGKNAIAMDADGNVYVSEGVNGLGVYRNGTRTGGFKIADYNASMARKYKDAAVNSLTVDDRYIYLAYGAAGLWVLDKNTYEPVSYYTNGGASANYVAVDGTYIYLAYGRAGVKVLKLD